MEATSKGFKAKTTNQKGAMTMSREHIDSTGGSTVDRTVCLYEYLGRLICLRVTWRG